MTDDNVTKFPQRVKVATITLGPLPPMPDGPFTVTIADARGTMFCVVFPDASGELPPDHNVRGTAGDVMQQLVVNLLTSFIRIFAGRGA
jgi:hypothetical protein